MVWPGHIDRKAVAAKNSQRFSVVFFLWAWSGTNKLMDICMKSNLIGRACTWGACADLDGEDVCCRCMPVTHRFCESLSYADGYVRVWSLASWTRSGRSTKSCIPDVNDVHLGLVLIKLFKSTVCSCMFIKSFGCKIVDRFARKSVYPKCLCVKTFVRKGVSVSKPLCVKALCANGSVRVCFKALVWKVVRMCACV